MGATISYLGLVSSVCTFQSDEKELRNSTGIEIWGVHNCKHGTVQWGRAGEGGLS